MGTSQGWSHDSWLSPARGAAPPGQLALELATGNRFPVQEFGHSAAKQAACATAAGARLALRPLREQARWLDLAAAVPQRASSAVVLAGTGSGGHQRSNRAWSRSTSRRSARRPPIGRPGRHCRHAACPGARAIASSPGSSWGRTRLARQPAGLDLEIVVLGNKPIAVGEPLEFQVLRDGRPFAGFPVELVSERSALGIWRETDADGKLRHSLPFAGRWLLRGTDLRPSGEGRTPGKAVSSPWRSRRAEVLPFV